MDIPEIQNSKGLVPSRGLVPSLCTLGRDEILVNTYLMMIY